MKLRPEQAMILVEELFQKISARQFQLADAREFIKRSYYFANTHPDVHIVLTGSGPADLHFQHLPQYEARSLHSMFLSMDDAASAVAAALNCAAGEASMRFLSVSSVTRVALYSRSGATHASEMLVRAAIGANGARTGTMYSQQSTALVVLALGIHANSVVLTTAYPTHNLPANRPHPPAGLDLLEYNNTQLFTYPMGT
jgi:hypothetical protein